MIHPEIIKAFGEVKLACAQTNILLGFWKENPEKAIGPLKKPVLK
jgi:aspartate ammonia-lyase